LAYFQVKIRSVRFFSVFIQEGQVLLQFVLLRPGKVGLTALSTLLLGLM